MSITERPFSYFGYGLQIGSAIPLTELPPREGAPDVSVDYGRFDAGLDRTRTHTFAASPRELGRYWRHVGAFSARDGREVLVAPDPHVQTSSLSPFITGPMMACLLHQRGYLVLHASAVRLGAAGIGLLGESGEGKSTLAAYLQYRGGTLISDDLVPVEFDGSVLTVPGYPQIRLWEDSLKTLGADHEKLTRVNEFVDKRFYPVAQEFPAGPVSLDALYILSDAPEIRIEPCLPADAFYEISRNSFLKRYIDATSATAGHFQDCARLARELPVYLLHRPRDFQHLPAAAEALARHAERFGR